MNRLLIVSIVALCAANPIRGLNQQIPIPCETNADCPIMNCFMVPCPSYECVSNSCTFKRHQPTECVVGGCSSQLCVDAAVETYSTCEWREQYHCYPQYGNCILSHGRCMWEESEALTNCLNGSN